MPDTPTGDGYPFELAEYEIRLRKVRERLVASRLDGLLVMWPENIYYLSGYQTPGYYMFQCLVVPVEHEPFFVVRHLEGTNVTTRSWIKAHVGVTDSEDPIEVLHRELTSRGLARSRLGIEMDSLSLSASRYLQIVGSLADISLHDGSGTVEAFRLIKSPSELAYVRQAARAAEAGMYAAVDATRSGASESLIAAATYHASILAGSEYPSLPAFITSGPNSSRAHSTWGDRVIEPGDMVYLEISGVIARYSSALMRTVSVGAPTPEVQRRASAILEGLENAISCMRPGVTGGDVDRAARSSFTAAGISNMFRHRTGYSIGVNFPPDWGEGHIMSLRPDEEMVLEAGMVFHLPPGILDVGQYGIGFSETVAVTESGHEVLTRFPRELLIRQ